MSQLSSAESRIPESLRAFLHRSSLFIPFRAVAERLYDYSARKIADRLLKIDGVSRVLWFGGSVSRLEPGISDIDMLVVVKENPTEGQLQNLRSEYQQLRKFIPMLVDLHVVTEDYWTFFSTHPSSAALWLSSMLERKDGGWLPAVLSLERVDRRGWLGLGLFHYARAMKLSGPTLPTAFREASFLREVAKAKAFALGAIVQKRTKAKASVLLAEAYGAATHSISILDGQRRFSGVLNVEYASDASDRFVNEVAQRRWHRVLRKGMLRTYPIEIGHIPDVLVWTGGKEIPEDIYGKISEGVRTTEVGSLSMPVVITWELHHFIMSGWYWGRMGSELSWVPLPNRSEELWNKRLGAETFDRYVDRLENALLFFWGNVIAGSPQKIQETIREIALVSLSLQTKILTSNIERLCEKAGSGLPACVRFLRGAELPSDILKLRDEIWREGYEVLQAVIKASPSIRQKSV